MNWKKQGMWVGAALLVAAAGAQAGEFAVSCQYKNDNLQKCASVVSDLVTDKFVAKFPANRFQIFIYSNILDFSNGGYSAYAVAGVIPKGSGQFPIRRFANTSINGSDKRFSAVDLANTEFEVYRAAVKALMDQCEISPTCDVYVPRDSK